MRVGIVGAEAAKFTQVSEATARNVIRALLTRPGVEAMVSGGCHLGGIDIWAEEIADELGIEPIVFRPLTLTWSTGFKPRNLRIADTGDEVHNIVVDQYPPTFNGQRFARCYHCEGALVGGVPIPPHVKSGGCWTTHRARERGKRVQWHVVTNAV